MIQDVLQDEQLFDIQVKSTQELYEQTEAGYVLKLYMPLLDKERLEMYESGTDLILKIDHYKRSIPLPNILRKSSISAKIEQDYVLVHFHKEDVQLG